MYTRVFVGVLLVACTLLYDAESWAVTASEVDGHGVSVTKFGDDLTFLRKHTETIVLSDENGTAEVVLAPAWQGRVMTSTAQGESGLSLGWINHKHIAAEKIVPHINLFGGEERFWLGPEGGQFSIFHGKDKGFGWDNWQVPPPLDSIPFQTVGHSRDRATFRASFSLTNYSGTVFQVEVRREVRLLGTKEAWSQLGLPPLEHVSLVAFESQNTLTNAGKTPWRKETGLLSIWIPGMIPASATAIFMAPIKSGPQSELGVEVTSDYFHTLGPDRLKVTTDAIYFRVDAGFQSKIGISPARSLGKFGSYDPERHLLTIVQFSQPKGVTEYVKSKWRIQKDPYAGDAINGYNDGPNQPGAEMFGPFYEMESSSPATALAPGESIEHTHRTVHLIGTDDALDKIARAALGISSKEMPSQ